MPKILRILNRLNIGGPTYNAAYLSKYINPVYDTHLLAGQKEPYEGSSEYMLNELGVPFAYVPDMYRSINPRNDVKAYRYIKQVVSDYKPDIVHTHAAKAGLLGRLAAHHNKYRPGVIVHTYHGNVFEGYFSPIKSKLLLAVERYLCNISTGIVAISENQKHDLAYKYKIAPEEKIHVIRLGFDLDKYAEESELKRRDFRAFYRLAGDVAVITITGRLTAIKNHKLFISALKILREQEPALKFKAFIVGDGELLEPIIDLIKQSRLTFCRAGENNYDADIIFTSWRKDIDVINAGSDIIALTSLNEGTPVSIIEALASGKGVICTDVGGVKDVISDGYSGFLSDMDPADYAGKLKELIVNNELRTGMALNGKNFALKNYSYHRLVKETEYLYDYLLNKIN